jgi:hypothetical protein
MPGIFGNVLAFDTFSRSATSPPAVPLGPDVRGLLFQAPGFLAVAGSTPVRRQIARGERVR